MFPDISCHFLSSHQVMGTDWWITKLRKYEDVRMKLTSSTSLSDQRADIEVARWEADEARKLRIAKRAQAIKREGSMVKLALLRADRKSVV